MQEIFYLDTARLGQISPSAKRALNGALEFNKAFGASAYFDDLLFGGAQALKNADEFDGLNSWEGIGRFKTRIKRCLFGSGDGDIVFASRTACLMSLAAKMLFARCRNVLVTDLCWDPYRQILQSSKSNEACRITEIKIKDRILNQKATAEEITQVISEAYCQSKCDGIFLPAVCNLGVALPVQEILQNIGELARIRFSVVDAAQAINHVDLQWATDTVDFTFGSTHKWLRAYEPMAVGYSSRPSSRSFIQDLIKRELETDSLADSLLRLTQPDAQQNSETANLCPLFAAAGALEDAESFTPVFDVNGSREAVRELASQAGWKEIPVATDFQSRIMLLKNRVFRRSNAGEIRKLLSLRGIAVTDYSGGICRLSLPESISEHQAWQFGDALKNIKAYVN